MKLSNAPPAKQERFGDFGASVVASAALLLVLGLGLLWLVWLADSPYLPGVVINNLRAIEVQKHRWAIEHGKQAGDTPSSGELAPYFPNRKFPPSVMGETYNLNPVGQQPTATFPSRVKDGARPIEAGTVVTIPDL